MNTPHENHSAIQNALPADPSRAMQEMMNIIDSLTRLYTQEADALEKTDTAEFISIMQNKEHMTNRYLMGFQNLINRKDEIKNSASPSLRITLEEKERALKIAGQRTVSALERMERCTKRLSDSILNAGREAAAKQRVFSYGENGIVNKSEHKTVSMGVKQTA